jgi:hypothetical protein
MPGYGELQGFCEIAAEWVDVGTEEMRGTMVRLVVLMTTTSLLGCHRMRGVNIFIPSMRAWTNRASVLAMLDHSALRSHSSHTRCPSALRILDITMSR